MGGLGGSICLLPQLGAYTYHPSPSWLKHSDLLGTNCFQVAFVTAPDTMSDILALIIVLTAAQPGSASGEKGVVPPGEHVGKQAANISKAFAGPFQMSSYRVSGYGHCIQTGTACPNPACSCSYNPRNLPCPKWGGYCYCSHVNSRDKCWALMSASMASLAAVEYEDDMTMDYNPCKGFQLLQEAPTDCPVGCNGDLKRANPGLARAMPVSQHTLETEALTGIVIRMTAQPQYIAWSGLTRTPFLPSATHGRSKQ